MQKVVGSSPIIRFDKPPLETKGFLFWADVAMRNFVTGFCHRTGVELTPSGWCCPAV